MVAIAHVSMGKRPIPVVILLVFLPARLWVIDDSRCACYARWGCGIPGVCPVVKLWCKLAVLLAGGSFSLFVVVLCIYRIVRGGLLPG